MMTSQDSDIFLDSKIFSYSQALVRLTKPTTHAITQLKAHSSWNWIWASRPISTPRPNTLWLSGQSTLVVFQEPCLSLAWYLPTLLRCVSIRPLSLQTSFLSKKSQLLKQKINRIQAFEGTRRWGTCTRKQNKQSSTMVLWIARAQLVL